MKTKNLSLICVITALCFTAPTFAQLGGLKNAAKSATKVIESSPSQKTKTETKTETKTGTSSSGSEVKANKGESGKDLYEKGNAAYNAKNYKEALSYYEAAQKNGYNDGEMRMKMNECKKYTEAPAGTNTDTNSPEYKKQQALLEEANALVEAGKINEGMAKLQQAHDACPTCPDAAEMRQLLGVKGTLGQLEDQKYDCKNITPDKGISSPAHTKYLKQFVFSKSEIKKGAEDPSAFTNSFNLSDNIYGRIYLEKSILNEAKSVGECNNNMPRYFMRWTFDGGATKMPKWINTELHNVIGIGNDRVAEWTTWQPGLSPAQNDMENAQSEIKAFVKFMRNLPAGNHKIKMELVYDIPDDKIGKSDLESYMYTTKFGPERVMATGEFSINITEESKKALNKKVCAMYKNEIADYNKPAFSLVPNVAATVKSTTGIDWNKFTLLKITGDNDWTYEKNWVGVILSRKCHAGAYLLNKEDNFIYYSNIEITETNTSSGGSTYGSAKVWVEEQNIEYTQNYDAFCKECIGK